MVVSVESAMSKAPWWATFIVWLGLPGVLLCGVLYFGYDLMSEQQRDAKEFNEHFMEELSEHLTAARGIMTQEVSVLRDILTLLEERLSGN